MKQYIKCGGRILFNYTAVLVFFAILIYPFMVITGDGFSSWMPVYSLVFFIFIAFLTYLDMKDQAVKEKKPQYEIDPRPWKGFVMGAIAFIPVTVIVSVLASLHLVDEFVDRLRQLAIYGILGPMYFVIKLLNGSIIGYIIAILILPLIAGLGYLAGYYGIEIISKLKKKKPVQERVFSKSPWNPSVNQTNKVKKKKKKTSGGQ